LKPETTLPLPYNEHVRFIEARRTKMVWIESEEDLCNAIEEAMQGTMGYTSAKDWDVRYTWFEWFISCRVDDNLIIEVSSERYIMTLGTVKPTQFPTYMATLRDAFYLLQTLTGE
jgi:hypothetical protein